MSKLFCAVFLLFLTGCVTSELDSISCSEQDFGKYLKANILEKDSFCKYDSDCYLIKTIDCCGVSSFASASKRGYTKERWRFIKAFSLRYEKCVDKESCDCDETNTSYTPNKFPACISGECKMLSSRCKTPPRVKKRANLFIYQRTKSNKRLIKKCIRYYD